MFHWSWLERKNHLPKSADSALPQPAQDAETIVQLSNTYSTNILQNLFIKLASSQEFDFLHGKPQLFTYMTVT